MGKNEIQQGGPVAVSERALANQVMVKSLQAKSGVSAQGLKTGPINVIMRSDNGTADLCHEHEGRPFRAHLKFFTPLGQ